MEKRDIHNCGRESDKGEIMKQSNSFFLYRLNFVLFILCWLALGIGFYLHASISFLLLSGILITLTGLLTLTFYLLVRYNKN